MRTYLIALAFIVTTNVYAHGEHKPKHGGIVRETKNFVIETVIKDGKAQVYMYDHKEKPADTKGAAGTVSVGRKDAAKVFQLKPLDANNLVAEGLPLVVRGETIAVDVTVGGTSISKVRFMAN